VCVCACVCVSFCSWKKCECIECVRGPGDVCLHCYRNQNMWNLELAFIRLDLGQNELSVVHLIIKL
jgi:hypothetical protein